MQSQFTKVFKLINNSIRGLTRLNYRHIFVDSTIILSSLYASLFLRVGWEGFLAHLDLINKYLPIFLLLRVCTFLFLGVYYIIWRYISVTDAVKLVKAIFFSTLIIIAATYLIDIGRLPRSLFFIDAILVTLSLCGVRITRRILKERTFKKSLREDGRLTLIYGSGYNGRTLANRFNIDNFLGYKLVGFVDDDSTKVGRVISGVRVLGYGKDLAEIIKRYRIQEVIVAIAHPTNNLLGNVVSATRDFHIRPRMIASVAYNNSEKKDIKLFRDIKLSDLLNRQENHCSNKSIKHFIRHKKVLVTGAGGSIGSELCRQIFDCNPNQLLLLDHSEYNLYKIDNELRLSQKETSRIVPLLIDIKDKNSLQDAMQQYKPDIVFHAAAYKHVHLVEANPYTSILNNVMGTKHLLDISQSLNVDAFVLISTDKAVNPVGIMGATKRACELMVTEVGERTGKRYCSVRFGNVLGSSGSLIPLLKKQIENKEPVTITHKEMTRYFMLIPEAISLILKAATISREGEILILKMGEPVKILDIAKYLMALMGRTEEEVPIIFTGMRPGEKMHEKLYMSGKELNTEHPDILILPKDEVLDKSLKYNTQSLMKRIEHMITMTAQGNDQSIPELYTIIDLYDGALPESRKLIEKQKEPYFLWNSQSPTC